MHILSHTSWYTTISIAFQKAVAYPKISFAKANTCIAVKSSSRSYGKKYLKNADGSSVGPETFARVLNQIQIVDGNMACFQVSLSSFWS
jgi:hypothetical protein